MARPRLKIPLFDSQFDALVSKVDELLVASASPGVPSGSSYLLRAIAVHACSANSRVRALLLGKNNAELQRQHRDGPTGFREMVKEFQRHGFAEVSNEEISFENGSTIRWLPFATEAEIIRLADEPVDVLLVDDVEDLPEHIYRRLRDRAFSSLLPSRRVVAATHSPSEGWIGRHWSITGARGVALLRPDELDPEMTVRPSRPSYRDWIERFYGRQWTWAPHVEAFVDAINRWINDEWEHLAIHVPSQHGKTTAGPRNAIPYILDVVAPDDWCSVASYQSEIASSRSADAREIYLRAGGALKPGRKKVKEWQTLAGGGCWSAGTSAGQIGRSSTWSFVDDGDKDWADAVNATQQKKKRRWYGSTYRSRESMFAAAGRKQKICLTATRWDPEDLAGYALSQGIRAGERWAILVLSALYDPKILDGYRQMYPGFHVIPDFRTRPGQPLWEDRRTTEDWAKVFIIRGPLIADCECQQNPRGAEKGGQFSSGWFQRLDRDPAFAGTSPNEAVYAATCRAWDLASTEGGGDYTAGVKVGRTLEDSAIIVRHAVRAQFAPVGVNHLIAAMMLLDGSDVTIRLPIDPAAGGEARADELVRYLRKIAGWVGMAVPRIVCERPRRGASATMSAKATRAHALRSLAEPPAKDIAGGVSFVGARWSPSPSNLFPNWDALVAEHPELREIAKKAELAGRPRQVGAVVDPSLFIEAAGDPGDWWTPWLAEMESFTGDDGRTDDQVDATVDGYEEVNVPPPALSGGSASVPGWSY